MIENMSVGVKITLTNDATPKLKLFLDQINKINIAVEALNERLKFTTGAFADLGKSFASSSNTLSRLNEKLSYTSKHMADAARNAVVFRQSLNGLGGGGGRRGGHGGSHLGGAIGREAGGGYIGSFLGGAAFGGLSTPLLVGGLGAVMLGKSAFEHYGAFQQAQAQFAAQGFGSQATNQASYMATHTNIRGVSSLDLMSAISDATTATRDPAKGMQLAPTIAKMIFANKALYSMQGQNFTRQNEMQLIKFAELKAGGTDPTKIGSALNLVEKGITSEAGRLKSLDLYTFSKQYGASLSMLSDTGLAALFPLIQSMGGNRAATGLQTLLTSMDKGQNLKTGKKAVAELERIGVYGKNGRLKTQYNAELHSDPIAFINDVLLKHIYDAGITSDAGVASEVNKLLTQTAGRVVMQTREQNPRIAASRRLLPYAAGIDAATAGVLNTQKGSTGALSASFDTLMITIGKLGNPSAMKGMSALTTLLDYINSILTKFSDYKPGDSAFGRLMKFSGNHDAFGDAAPGQAAVKTAVEHAGKVVIQLATSAGKTLGELIMPNLNYGLYQAQIGNQSTYNNSMHGTPPVVSNTFSAT